VKPHVFHPEAREEYFQAVQYYADIAPELGGRLYDEIERLIREIRREPRRFFQFSPPARRALARRFPYSVVYVDEPEHVWVVAVMHAKRRPGYWRERLGQLG
jgi:toxin ParE1/3/4